MSLRVRSSSLCRNPNFSTRAISRNSSDSASALRPSFAVAERVNASHVRVSFSVAEPANTTGDAGSSASSSSRARTMLWYVFSTRKRR
jgi:hypothetical protein